MSADPPRDPSTTSNVVPIEAARKRAAPATPMPERTGVAQLQGDPLLANLRESCLSDATIDAARVFVMPSTDWKRYGFRPSARPQSGLFIPFFAPGASEPHCYRLKPQHPIPAGKRFKKYDQPKDSGLLVYTPPLTACLDRLRDTDTVLLWTEGEKKALLLAQLGYAVVGLTGVDAWHDVEAKDRGEGRRLHPYIREHYGLAARHHVVVFDADARTNTNVMGAMQRLAGVLGAEGAASVSMCLPPAVDGGPKGIDDYAAAHGLDACAALLVNQREPIEAAEPDVGCVPLKAFGRVFVGSGVEETLRMPRGYTAQRDGSIWLDDDPEVEPRPVLDAPMLITRRLHNKYTRDQRLEVAFKTSQGHWARAVAPREALGERGLVMWLRRYGAVVNASNAGQAMRYLDAFEMANGERIEHTTGVPGYGFHDGQFVLHATLHRAGETPVQLDADPETMRMRHALGPCEGATMRAHADALDVAMQASAECSLAVYAALAAPLLYLLKQPNFAVHLCGDSSTGKTSMLKIAASVYGDPHNAAWLASWNGTPTSQLLRAAVLNDLPQFYDEVGAGNIEALQENVYRLVNGQGKTRASRDANLRTVASWRTVVISTGERELADERDAVGAQVRVLNVPVTGFGEGPGALTGPQINACVRACAAQRGAVGVAWLQWLVDIASDEDAVDAFLRSAFRAREAELQAIAEAQGDRLGGRAAGYYACLWLAEDLAAQFYELGKPRVLEAFRTRCGPDGGGRVLTARQTLGQVLRDWVQSDPYSFPEVGKRIIEGRRVFGYRLDGGDVGFIQTELTDYLTKRGMRLTLALKRELTRDGVLVREGARTSYAYRITLADGTRGEVYRLRLGLKHARVAQKEADMSSDSFNDSE